MTQDKPKSFIKSKSGEGNKGFVAQSRFSNIQFKRNFAGQRQSFNPSTFVPQAKAMRQTQHKG